MSCIINIKSVMDRLKEKRKVFVSEADFQLELAWVIKELYPLYNVRLEYCPPFDRKMHLDILIFTPDGWIPIELKYKTKGCTIVDGDETFILANHAAKDINCYLYLKDLQRIEQIRDNTEDFAEGYTIMLTNEQGYLDAPKKADCVYAEFSLHNGTEKTGKMSWSEKAGEGTIRGHENPITLFGNYPVKWELYSKLNDSSSGSFYYLINQVK